MLQRIRQLQHDERGVTLVGGDLDDQRRDVRGIPSGMGNATFMPRPPNCWRIIADAPRWA